MQKNIYQAITPLALHIAKTTQEEIETCLICKEPIDIRRGRYTFITGCVCVACHREISRRLQ
ncbi:MAG: hypothetical protein WCQ99_02320 [Pseudomonadota bacterium]